MGSVLQGALEAYDGRRVIVLERIRDDLPVSAAVLSDAMTLAASERSATAAGATWLLRAWAMDALHRLALEHPDYEPMARQALEQGLDDPAASVRARVRRIQKGD